MGEQLLAVKQGWRHEVDYGLQFCTRAAGSGGNELALKDAFCQGLNTEVLTELVCWDDQVTLYSFLDLAICLDNHAGYQAIAQDKLTFAESEKQRRN